MFAFQGVNVGHQKSEFSEKSVKRVFIKIDCLFVFPEVKV